jgi:hypothetical protein
VGSSGPARYADQTGIIRQARGVLPVSIKKDSRKIQEKLKKNSRITMEPLWRLAGKSEK